MIGRAAYQQAIPALSRFWLFLKSRAGQWSRELEGATDALFYSFQALVFITRSGIGLIVLHCRQLGQHQCRDLATKPQLSQQ